MAGTWTRGTDMLTGGSHMGITAVKDKIHCLGHAHEVYNINTNQWSTASFPDSGRLNHAVSIEGKIYALSGMQLFIYDIATDTWTTGTNAPTINSGNAALAAGGCKIYYLYGSAFEIYDTQTGSWEIGEPMPTARTDMGCAVVNNKVYCIGGCNSPTYYNCVEIYDIESRSWSAGSAMPTQGFAFGCTVVGSKIFCAGPRVNTLSDQHYVYDTTTDSWATESTFPRKDHYMRGVGVRNKMYYFGGNNEPKRLDIYTLSDIVKVTVTSTFKTEDGITIQPSTILNTEMGEDFNTTAPDIKGYIYIGYKINGCTIHTGRVVNLEALQANSTIAFIYIDQNISGKEIITHKYQTESGTTLQPDSDYFAEVGQDYSATASIIPDYTCIGYKLDDGLLQNGTTVTINDVQGDHTITFVYKQDDGTDPGTDPNPGNGCCCNKDTEFQVDACLTFNFKLECTDVQVKNCANKCTGVSCTCVIPDK